MFQYSVLKLGGGKLIASLYRWYTHWGDTEWGTKEVEISVR